MQQILIYDPKPPKNEYISPVFFTSMMNYYNQKNISIGLQEGGSLLEIKNKNLVLNGQHLNAEIITALRNNGNSIFSFDINDSSWPLAEYYNIPEMELINCIFKFSGIQNVQKTKELIIANDLSYQLQDYEFLNDELWAKYRRMVDAGRFVSLPYVPWVPRAVQELVPYEQRRKTCSIRGGNQLLRFHLFLNILKNGFLDSQSGFLTQDYYAQWMPDQFRYCQQCINEKTLNSKFSYQRYKELSDISCNRAFARTNLNDQVFWNNRCAPLFYWLTEQFEQKYGPIDKAYVENSLNATRFSDEDLDKVMMKSLMYGDYKWRLSIYIPPRYWEAARTKTVSLFPKYTNEQSYFPEMLDGKHYLTFNEDFSNMENLANISKEQYEYIATNAFNAYSTYLLGDRYTVSERLMDYILQKIQKQAV